MQSGSGFRIGKIAGITIRIDWSWLLILLLITWNLSTAFSDYRAEWTPGERWGLALIAALLFFVSLLAHEMAHSLVARARGVPVRNITLFLFGGVSNIERDPDSPESEFQITVVGPITSFVIGVVLLVIANVIAAPDAMVAEDMISELSPLALIVYWLGSVNVLLAVFNLIPGFPLDGGRLLRSALWRATGDLTRATRWASWTGQAIAWLMITAGIAMAFGARIPFFGSGFGNGLWLAFIGWFLNMAAIQSYQRIVINDVLEDVTVAQMMRANPPVVAGDITVSDLVHKYVMGTDDHAFPVVDEGRLVGLVTLEDVRRVQRSDWEQTLVSAIMTPADDLITTHPDEPAEEAWEKLTRRDVRQLPVVRGAEVVGVLRRSDIIKWLRLQAEL